jgi:hypothetical protein
MVPETTLTTKAADDTFVASPVLGVGKLAGTLVVIVGSAVIGGPYLQDGMASGGIPKWSPYFLAVVAVSAFFVVAAAMWLWYRFVRLEVHPDGVTFRYPITWAGTGRGGLIIAGMAVIIIGITASPTIWFAVVIGVLSIVMALGRGIAQFLERRPGGGYDLKTSVTGTVPKANLRSVRRWPSPVGRLLGYGSVAIGYRDEAGQEGAIMLHGLARADAAVDAIRHLVPPHASADDHSPDGSQDSA